MKPRQCDYPCPILATLAARNSQVGFGSVYSGASIGGRYGRYFHTDRAICPVCGTTWDWVVNVEDAGAVM